MTRRANPTQYALSVQQPWAWAILHAGKDIENRTWAPPRHIIGRRIWIHASKKRQPIEPSELLPSFTLGELVVTGISGRLHLVPELRELPLGAILGSVRVVGTTRIAKGNRWFSGPIGWVLTDPSPLARPVATRGSLGLWKVPGGVVERLTL